MERIKHSFGTVLRVFAIGTVLMVCVGVGLATAESSTTITILHSSDGESALLANDYSGSVAQFGAVLDAEIDKVGRHHALVVSSGDNFLAGIEYSASQGRFDAQALNLMRYDVSAIGNHEFDFGTEGFARFVDEARFELVSSNLDFSEVDELSGRAARRIKPYVVVRKGGTRIGIVGATTESISYISSPGNTIINDVESSLRDAVAALEERDVDIIVALTHLQNIEEEKKLAAAIDGIDVYVAGGGDDLIGNSNNSYLVRTDRDGNPVTDEPTGAYPFETTTPNGSPVVVVSTDGSYNYIGKLDISFDDNGVITEIGDESGPIPVPADAPIDSRIERNIVSPVKQQIEQFAVQSVGSATDGLDGTRELVRTRETSMGNAITDGYLYTLNRDNQPVDFAFTNGGGIRRSVVVERGADMTKQELLTALPFSNYLTIVNDLTADEIKQLFEHSVAGLPEASGRFLQVSGVTVTYDSSADAGARVQSIAVGNTTIVQDGEVVDTTSRFSGVTNNFLAGGGDGYEVLKNIPTSRKVNSGHSYAEAFEFYLVDESPVNSEISGRLIDINS